MIDIIDIIDIIVLLFYILSYTKAIYDIVAKIAPCTSISPWSNVLIPSC